MEKLHSLRKQVLFVENDVVLKSILDEREACVTLPNITVLKTRIDRIAFRGDELIEVLAIGRGERDYLRSEGVILAPNFLSIMFFGTQS